MLLAVLFSLLSIPPTFAGVSRTIPPTGAIVVRQTGASSGQFTTIGAALTSLSGTAPATIFIFPGTYNEQVNITHPSLTIMGSTTEFVIDGFISKLMIVDFSPQSTGSYKDNTVTITHNLNAQDNGGNDACATVRATSSAPDLRIYNVNIVNSFGPGKQATALSATGTRQGFYGLSVTGYQDTLLADGGGTLTYQYYSNCYIEGAVDYIYGSASAWFGECTIASNGGGAITANSRDNITDPSYYVIDSSVIASAISTSLVGDVYLGRPWRMYARVIFQNSVLPNLINPAGYTTLDIGATPIYSEIDNTGAGANTSKRVMYTPMTVPITHAQVLGSDYNTWLDESF
ncbi:Pectin methyl esterase [Mycena sanguinolenta]|uniref:pectinesterase n=1 Tax=Mycena sanguinolenta TaxID=230812 RepID=A0A8H6XXU2_9AGAR|nr:Pectin methyl esterase [Mycena sanguinolenta]